MFAQPIGLPASKPMVTTHRPLPDIWLLEMHNGVDNRLTEAFIQTAFMPALDIIEKQWRNLPNPTQASTSPAAVLSPAALIISGGLNQQKFFSNGLDYEASSATPGFFANIFQPFLKRLLLYPIPTIAAINGHAFAGGWLVALACDYRVMTDGSKRHAWASMNEIHFGAPWPLPIASLFRAKCSSPHLIHQFALEGKRFLPVELLKCGMVDALGSSTEAVIPQAKLLGEQHAAKATTGVWGLIKKDLYRDVVKTLNSDIRSIMPSETHALATARL